MERSEFLKRIQQLVMKLATYAPVDVAADEVRIYYFSVTLSIKINKELQNDMILSAFFSFVVQTSLLKIQIRRGGNTLILKRVSGVVMTF